MCWRRESLWNAVNPIPASTSPEDFGVPRRAAGGEADWESFPRKRESRNGTDNYRSAIGRSGNNWISRLRGWEIPDSRCAASGMTIG